MLKRMLYRSLLSLTLFPMFAVALPSQITFPAPIPGGNKHVFYFRFDRLAVGMRYRVTCHYKITVNGQSVQRRFEAQTLNLTSFPFSLNGVNIPAFGNGSHLIQNEGELAIDVAISSPGKREQFVFWNTDNLLSLVNFDACYAQSSTKIV